MTRVVLDPNVVVSALIAPGGPPAGRSTRRSPTAPTSSSAPSWLAEITEVVARPRFRRWFSRESAQVLIAEMWRAGLQFDDPARSEPLGPDPDDDYLLALAEVAGAVLVTGDLALVEHQGVVTVLSPAAFLATRTPEGT